MSAEYRGRSERLLTLQGSVQSSVEAPSSRQWSRWTNSGSLQGRRSTEIRTLWRTVGKVSVAVHVCQAGAAAPSVYAGGGYWQQTHLPTSPRVISVHTNLELLSITHICYHSVIACLWFTVVGSYMKFLSPGIFCWDWTHQWGVWDEAEWCKKLKV